MWVTVRKFTSEAVPEKVVESRMKKTGPTLKQAVNVLRMLDHLGESERPQDHDATGASSSYGTLLRAAALEHPSDPSQHTSMSLVNGELM